MEVNTDCRADVLAKEILNENFEDDAARVICYVGMNQFWLEIYFSKPTYMAHKTPIEGKRGKNGIENEFGKFGIICVVPGMH